MKVPFEGDEYFLSTDSAQNLIYFFSNVHRFWSELEPKQYLVNANFYTMISLSIRKNCNLMNKQNIEVRLDF